MRQLPRIVAMVVAAVAAFESISAWACPAHAVPLPVPAVAAGAPKEVKELLDTPFVKLVSITLRGGTTMAEHSAPVAVTIQALAGSAVIKYGDKQEKVGPGQLVLLGPGTLHTVVPDGKGEVVLLVHFLKAATEAKPAEHHHDK